MEDFLSLLDVNKKIRAGVRVKGKFGPLVPKLNAKPSKNTRRICSEGTGIVLCRVEAKMGHQERPGWQGCGISFLNHDHH